MFSCSSKIFPRSVSSGVPKHRTLALRGMILGAGLMLLLSSPVWGLQATVQGTAVAGARLELLVTGVPAAANPLDPDQIQLDATLQSPSGKAVAMPGFWYQGYTRSLNGSGVEVLKTSGFPGWRVRFWPGEAGQHQLSLKVRTNGVEAVSLSNVSISVGEPSPGKAIVAGAPRLTGTNGYFQTAAGTPLPLVGANVCWYHGGGTFDYDTWFSHLAASGGNFARLWMAPWAFGIESEVGTLTKYRQDRAWQLDRVFQLAEEKGIQLMLCLEYHGMFATKPDSAFGGNDNWKINPYNSVNGGPCAAPDAFFTNPTAQSIYKKRLRYLIGRYAASPNLLAWEFFNEIDNVYDPQNGGLNAAHVASWHGSLGSWLKGADPYQHLVTTSLTGSSDRPELWNLPAIDFAQFHAYGIPDPANALAGITTRMRNAYKKPMMIGEFGMDFRGWRRAESDPYLRGFRQALWSGAVGGSVGTGMSWWWEDLDAEGVYGLHRALRSILNQSHWGRCSWTPISLPASPPRPATVGDPLPGTSTFTALLTPSFGWGTMSVGQLAVTDTDAAASAATALNAFVHGSVHSELRTPFKLSAWFDTGARVVAHVNSVSSGARLAIYVDGVSVLSTNLPDKDGKFDAQANEYNVDIAAPIAAGKHLVELRNTGGDWLFLDWVKLEKVRPSSYAGSWEPPLATVGMRGSGESLLYVVSPWIQWPANATSSVPRMVEGRSVNLNQWPAGRYAATWYRTTNGVPVGITEATSTAGGLSLPVPAFNEDLAAIVVRKPSLKTPKWSSDGTLRAEVDADPGSSWNLERSDDLVRWTLIGKREIDSNPALLDLESPAVPPASSVKTRFYRLSQPGL